MTSRRKDKPQPRSRDAVARPSGTRSTGAGPDHHAPLVDMAAWRESALQRWPDLRLPIMSDDEQIRGALCDALSNEIQRVQKALERLKRSTPAEKDTQ